MTDRRVALITGGAHGLGAALGRRLAAGGDAVVLADVDDEAGKAVAAEIGGSYVHCDVRDPEQSVAAVAAAVEAYGGLDVAVLNAGLTTGTMLDTGFDLERYRLAMGVNLDGVAFGVVAALPALRARGGGDIVATASLAGLTAVPIDPVYAANKHAVVGMVRSLGPVHEPEGIRVNAVCPSWADTAIIDGIRGDLEGAGVPILTPGDYVDAVLAVLAAQGAGECWYVQAGRAAEPFRFRNVPGPRSE